MCEDILVSQLPSGDLGQSLLLLSLPLTENRDRELYPSRDGTWKLVQNVWNMAIVSLQLLTNFLVMDTSLLLIL